MIKTHELQKVYKATNVETLALGGIDLEIGDGEFVSIMGPSGCGKSTLLNMIGLLDRPSAGRIWFGDQEVSNLPERARTRFRRGRIGFVFQGFNLLDHMTVRENVELPLIYMRTPPAKRKERVQEILARVRIDHRKDHHPKELSGGQQQRVAIARAIVTHPSLILADEPTGNLDSINGAEIMKLLSTLNEEATTIIMVTHSSTDAGYSHRRVELHDGKIVT